ncbi:hypothetical protein DPMN_180786 [Dreissena polymorpha]|uniref:Uncharacterized protein n=1 Tax=Dreissena polymorpha TaxID=45954 RepID=A0A9D4I355_DREPO|nr:hypothetical protein DPMN_180786 [Dreissena polymorpha]
MQFGLTSGTACNPSVNLEISRLICSSIALYLRSISTSCVMKETGSPPVLLDDRCEVATDFMPMSSESPNRSSGVLRTVLSSSSDAKSTCLIRFSVKLPNTGDINSIFKPPCLFLNLISLTAKDSVNSR